MKEFPIPVVPAGLLGPGTQADAGDGFSYMPIPREGLQPFSMPQVPENADLALMAAAREVLAAFVETMGAAGAPAVDLAPLPAGVVEILNQTLGEGEVSVRIAQHNGAQHELRIQETVFAGVWRQRHHDGSGRLLHDFLVAAPIPPVAVESAERSSSPMLPAIDIPAGAMNAPSLLAEIRSRVAAFQPGKAAHVINLTLLPLSADDVALLDRALPAGGVAILSRGFGNCRVTSTGVRHLWRVQYFNSMQTLILNTLEVTRVPEVALAAPEDLADSRSRMLELLEWMAESAAA